MFGVAGKIVAIGIDIRSLVNLVRLVEFLAVQVDLFVDQADAVAGNTDHALDVVFLDIQRIPEHDNVAALYRFVRQQVTGEGPGGCVRHAVDDEMIADEQVVFHRRRRNHEGLRNGARGEDQDDEVKRPLGDAMRKSAGRRLGLGLRHGQACSGRPVFLRFLRLMTTSPFIPHRGCRASRYQCRHACQGIGRMARRNIRRRRRKRN